MQENFSQKGLDSRTYQMGNEIVLQEVLSRAFKIQLRMGKLEIYKAITPPAGPERDKPDTYGSSFQFPLGECVVGDEKTLQI
jgi:hypothetical protein